MIPAIKSVNVVSLLTAFALCIPLVLTGCQPEGTGSVKGPAQRGDDSALGRPFGNAPVIPKKKKATESEKDQKPDAMNPRL